MLVYVLIATYLILLNQDPLKSTDFGNHLLEVENLLQKHALIEADIAVQADRVSSANEAALKFANGDS